MTRKANDSLVLGVDLGGTKTLVGVVDANHQVLGRGKLSTPARQGGDAIVETIAQAAEIALAEAGKSMADIALLGIGSPGPLDVKNGVILFSANMDVINYPLAAKLKDRFGLTCIVQNDVRSSCYAEWKLGAGKGMENLLGAFVGTGLGGCVIINGQMIEGKNGNAGEIGHIMAKPDGKQCGCGLYGCLELYASKSGLMRRFDKARKQGVASHLFKLWNGKGQKLKSRYLAECYSLGDPFVIEELQLAAKYLGNSLGGLVNLLAPDAIILGGGLSLAMGEPWLTWVRAAAKEHMLVVPHEGEIIIPAALGDDAGVLGSALLAREATVPSTPL
ncbi:MAG: ROK family protein [Planctomycetota bacterium]